MMMMINNSNNGKSILKNRAMALLVLVSCTTISTVVLTENEKTNYARLNNWQIVWGEDEAAYAWASFQSSEKSTAWP